jgi:cardiolipin synthase A/B
MQVPPTAVLHVPCQGRGRVSDPTSTAAGNAGGRALALTAGLGLPHHLGKGGRDIGGAHRHVARSRGPPAGVGSSSMSTVGHGPEPRGTSSARGSRPSIVGAHEVEILRDGRDVFPAMLGAIEAATRSIRLEMYWVGDDATGRAFSRALEGAARRGVDVRVIVDGFGSVELEDAFWRGLHAAGGQATVYRPLRAALRGPLRPRAFLARDHRKVLVVDDRVAFVGGLNLGLQWSPVEEGGEDWRDTAVRVCGPELPLHLVRVFESTWRRKRKDRPPRPENLWSTEGGRLGVLTNEPEKRRGRRIRQAYLWAFRRARSSIDLTCAYLAPRRLFVHALKKAVARGVRVRILLPAKSDVWLADLLAAPVIHMLDRHGVEIYGYEGRMLHAKTALVDEQLFTVGSHNLDTLSWAYNLECNVFVDDPGVGAEASAMFEEDLRTSVRLPAGERRLEALAADTLATVLDGLYRVRL